MDKAFTTEQAMLRDSLRNYLSTRQDFAGRMAAVSAEPGYRPDLWRYLARDMGLMDAAGLGDTEAMILMEEAGRALLPEPLAECLLAGWLLRRCGLPAEDGRLQAMASGDLIAALAWVEPSMRHDLADIALEACREGGGWRLTGMKAIVPAGPWCGAFILAARTAGRAGDADGISLFLVPADAPGLVRHPYATIDGRRAADLLLDGVTLPADALLGREGEALPLLEEARDRAIALQAAEAVGVLDRLLEQTVAYTGQRRQFGQAIAGFQALQHRMVDMYLECEMARAAARLVTAALDEPAPERARAASSAQATIAAACRFVGQNAVQLHGGMGMTDELPLGHYFRRTTVIEAEWGDEDWHLARMARLAGAA